MFTNHFKICDCLVRSVKCNVYELIATNKYDFTHLTNKHVFGNIYILKHRQFQRNTSIVIKDCHKGLKKI